MREGVNRASLCFSALYLHFSALCISSYCYLTQYCIGIDKVLCGAE